ESAHASGEPGCVFLERANKESNTWYFENIISVNPCGEQPLPAWGVCNLGAINLAAFAVGNTIDWKNLGKTVRVAMRFMDNVIDATPYAFEENRIAQMKVRRTGLGTMGLGDFLIKLGVRYGSDEAVALAEDVYRFMRDETYRASVENAAEKGPFGEFDRDKFMETPYIQGLPEDIKTGIRRYGIRNGVLQTQAPTGTTSILAGVSSGIEPVYDFAFKRTDRIGEHIVYHKLYQEYTEQHPNEPIPDYFVNAKQLTPMEHVKMQAVAQKYTDASISKTVNAPESHTHEDVKELYISAYELGCKGVTYYRENSRDVSVLSSLDSKAKEKKTEGVGLTQQQSGDYVPPAIVTGKTAEPVAEAIAKHHIEPLERPEVVAGRTYKVKTAYGKLYVTVNEGPDGTPFEVFANIGKAGGFFAAKTEAICRLASLALRSGIAAEEVIKQLKGIRGPMPSFGTNGTKILSLADAIAQILERHIRGDQATLNLGFAKQEASSTPVAAASSVSFEQSIADKGFAPQCPECGGDLAMESGCYNCHSCGYSKCG
ncbi:MAG: ribonucleoside-diphosphate reductase, adenosylcobalamin-dependent, partial [Parcubacteria group bacterium]|nr:ribonucleoside-diphosphate reductase, adenosylcobalamin-dependent [Parcubacteria group bacterium]